MKKIILSEQIKLKAVECFKNGNRQLKYYLEMPGKERMYAFTRAYTNGTYNICKSGIRVNELSTKRSKDKAVMKLVNYLNFMLPYLTEYYDLKISA